MTTVSRLRARTVTGAISSSNRPASIAAIARWWLASANASWSSRLTWSLIATRSAWVPMWQSSMAHHRPSWTVESIKLRVAEPVAEARAGSRNGAWFIDSMPPATTTRRRPP